MELFSSADFLGLDPEVLRIIPSEEGVLSHIMFFLLGDFFGIDNGCKFSSIYIFLLKNFLKLLSTSPRGANLVEVHRHWNHQ
jgi:hypothetical protein